MKIQIISNSYILWEDLLYGRKEHITFERGTVSTPVLHTYPFGELGLLLFFDLKVDISI